MSKSIRFLLAVAFCGATIAALAAQPGNPPTQPGTPPAIQPSQPGQPVQPAQPGQGTVQPGQVTSQPARTDAHAADRFILGCLIRENRAEIRMAKFAEKEATSKAVKEFAQHMEKDHSDFLTKLEQFRNQLPGRAETYTTNRTDGTATGTTDSTAAQRREERRDDRREARRERVDTITDTAQGHNSFVMQIEQEVLDRVLTTFEKEFQAEGRSFDHAYAAQQVFLHLKMADQLEVFKNHASPELQKLIAQGEETTQQHLKMARDLKKELGEDHAQSTSTERKD